MSDFDRKKYSLASKNKLFTTRDSGGGRNKLSTGAKESTSDQIKIKQPTILLKTREPVSEDVSASPKRTQKENESTPVTIATSVKESEALSPTLKHMTRSTKLIDEGIICTESLQDFVQENSDFLVIGVIGPHGAGKSTIMNLLAHNKVTDELKKSVFNLKSLDKDSHSDIKILSEQLQNMNINRDINDKNIFKVQTTEDIECNLNATRGIDIFITSNRVILLDSQPFSSVAVLEELIECENKRTNLVSEFIPLENSGEIQGLQLTAFLMSVCHILLVVQDWFLDSNVVRFIHSAEMLRPTISNPEDEFTEHFPHCVLVHNRAFMEDFTPAKFKKMQKIYKMFFQKTKLQIQSNLGMGSGRIINRLNPENCGSPINLFLIPEVNSDTKTIYNGHPPIEDIVKRLRANLLGATKNSLTHVQLTEKTWLLYCAKVWETVKKSPFFVEYTKLMP